MYPNEMELQWGSSSCSIPFITGLVAGAFILASLERVFKVEQVKPTYRLALLTALAFLLVAPLPLQLHLGHPERSFEMYLTPHSSSAMAMFGFVYLWYLMAVLLLEIWLEWRREIVAPAARPPRAPLRLPDLTLGSRRSRSARARPRRPRRLAGHADRHPLRLPAARVRRLHLRVGEGESLVVHAADADRVPLLRHRLRHRPRSPHVHGVVRARGVAVDMRCADTMGRYLLYAFVIDFSLEMLDLLHRVYEADESFKSLDFMVHTRLYASHILVQIVARDHVAHRAPRPDAGPLLTERARRGLYAAAPC
jgi:hypothetical protein